MKKIDMPKGAAFIIEQLNNSGFEAYIVGGCVRDCLIGKKPNDWDITTDAKPNQVKQIFKRTVDTGIEHGTVTVLIYPDKDSPLESYEVTTYRIDGEYENHRRPKSVSFSTSLKEDLKRRDFTINAMAYNDRDGLVDIFGGIEDLNNGIVRCVGNPDERFDEDALRILRAVRFAASLGFEIDSQTVESIKSHAKYLKDISAERIQVELTKLITSDNPDRIVTAYELGLTRIILPEFDRMMETPQNNPYHKYNVGIHTVEVMKHTPPDMVLRYAALLHDVGKPACKTTDENGVDHFYGHQSKGEEMSRTIMRRLKHDNASTKLVAMLVKYHDYGISENVGIKAFRRFLGKIGVDNFCAFMLIKRADMEGQSDYRLEDRLSILSNFESMYDEIIKNNHCLTKNELKIGGSKLIEMGFKPGRQLGQILDELLEEVLDDPKKNDSEILSEIVKNRYQK